MRDWEGDIWDRLGKSFVVVPTNIGWKRTRSTKPGPNVMGAGLALQAVNRVGENLPKLYGEFCARFGEATPVTCDLATGVVLFPTKPLAENPSMSWKGKASLELIQRSAKELASMKWMTSLFLDKHADKAPKLENNDVYVPLVGCGNGGLDPSQVVPLLKEILVDDRFILVQHRPF